MATLRSDRKKCRRNKVKFKKEKENAENVEKDGNF